MKPFKQFLEGKQELVPGKLYRIDPFGYQNFNFMYHRNRQHYWFYRTEDVPNLILKFIGRMETVHDKTYIFDIVEGGEDVWIAHRRDAVARPIKQFTKQFNIGGTVTPVTSPVWYLELSPDNNYIPLTPDEEAGVRF